MRSFGFFSTSWCWWPHSEVIRLPDDEEGVGKEQQEEEDPDGGAEDGPLVLHNCGCRRVDNVKQSVSVRGVRTFLEVSQQIKPGH